MRSVVGSLAVALAMLGCEYSTSFVGMKPVEAPGVFSRWHAEVGECLGLTEDFGRIEWHQADAMRFRGRVVLGVWQRPHRIVLEREYVEWVRGVLPAHPDNPFAWQVDRDHAAVAKHEMIHDYLQTSSHEHWGFGECDGIGFTPVTP